jgi:hypothetical protein
MISVSITVVTSIACGVVWPFRISKSFTQRNRIPMLAMPATELLKKNRTKSAIKT